MKKVAFIAHGPDTANALYPIVKAFVPLYEVHLFAFHDYAAILWNVPKKETYELAICVDETFDLIVTGTGSLHITEHMVPILGKAFGVPVVSLLDSWGNYEKRFQIPPDYIICLDENSQKEIENLGFPKEKLFPFGNPHFDRLCNYQAPSDLKKEKREAAFFSQGQAISEKALESLAEIIKENPSLYEKIYVTPHPSEDIAWLRNFCKKQGFCLKQYDDPFSLLLQCETAIGVHATLLYEAMMLEKKAIFYKEKSQLKRELLNKSNKPQKKIQISFGATEKCVTILQKILEEKEGGKE